MFRKKKSGHIFTINASKNEAVYREVQTHFGTSPPPTLTKIFLGTLARFMHPKTKLFAMKFRRILKLLRSQCLEKESGRICTIYASKNEAA